MSLISKDAMRWAEIIQTLRTRWADIFHAREELEAFIEIASKGFDADKPIPIKINCPNCGASHVDEGEFATKRHHTHSCQTCGLTWRPAIVHTVGVQFLPGFKNESPK